ncbi:MAG: hypothetical protein M1818_007943 [Claussenomyces sp. TS43310]|nr:MAG: hypothetical protein M1818_007943 [Claussenomyces sp. TS43310]
MATTTSSEQPEFSSGEDAETLSTSLASLAEAEGGRWRLMTNGKGVERTFKFKTFKKTWVYNTTFIRWTTHSPPGLSGKDLSMARFCTEQARLHGVVDEDELDGSKDSLGRGLADRVASDGGDCCVPKAKGQA